MLKRFLHYYHNHKLAITLDMIASLIVAIIGVGYPILTRLMLADWIPNQKMDLFIIGCISLLGIYLVRALLRFFIQYYGHTMGVMMQAEMRTDLFNKLQKLPYSYFDNHETGDLMSTMTNDLFEISELAHHGPENLLMASFTIIGSVIYLMTINWILGLILLAVVPILFLITWFFRKTFRDSMRRTRKATAKINARMESSVSGVRVTKAFTNQELESKKFEACNNEYVEARYDVFKSMATYFSVSQFITDFFNILVMLLGGLFLYYGFDQFKVADYSTFVVSVSLFITPITTLINFMEGLESGVAGFERFIKVMDAEEETDKNGTEILTNVEGKLEFKHVSFSYIGTNGILNDVSFTLEKGKTLALVGPSGGGKTSICHLIPRFYFLNTGCGEILLDDKNIESYTLDSLRSNIGIVQQDVFLFNGSIKENILYGKPSATDEELVEAAMRANIYDYIMSLPEKWETNIGERGVRLSGGQKQRLSIARIFLKNPPLLIFDEATSALDNLTELMIQKAFNDLAKGRTCILVAHRLSTIKSADVIAVIDHGKIQEMGTHQELLNQGGRYKELYELQFRLDEK